MSLSVETYALCKKYCDTHASHLTPEQAVQAVANYFEENPDSIVTNDELENILNGYITTMPGDEYTNGNAYNLPYYFSTSADANKVTVTAKTVTLDGNKTHSEYNMEVSGATTTTAGLMTASDKTKLNSAIIEHQDLSAYAKTSEVIDAINEAVSELVNNAPETLDTLKELADNFDGVATQEWVEGKKYIQDVVLNGDSIVDENGSANFSIIGLPDEADDGQILIYKNQEWQKQGDYGYDIASETIVEFEGNINGLEKIDTSFFPFYKIKYDGYLPSSDDLMGKDVAIRFNGVSSYGTWSSDNIQSSPEGTLELMFENFSCSVIIVYDDVTMSKYDNAKFTKGIWFACQDDQQYVRWFVFGPIIRQIDSRFIPSDDNKANSDEVVNLTEDQTIGGNKTFSNSISFESGLSSTFFGSGGVTIGAFAQPTTKYNFATDGADYVVDGEVTIAAREWVEAQGYVTADNIEIEGLDDDELAEATDMSPMVFFEYIKDADNVSGEMDAIEPIDGQVTLPEPSFTHSTSYEFNYYIVGKEHKAPGDVILVDSDVEVYAKYAPQAI